MPGDASVSAFLVLLVASFHSVRPGENCFERTSVKIADAQTFPDGSVWDREGRIHYPPQAVRSEDGVLYGCPCNIPGRPCLRKCCAMDQAMNFTTLECEPYHAEDGWFRPNLTVDEVGTTHVLEDGQFAIFHGNHCLGYLLEPKFYREDVHYLHLGNGSLLIPDRSGSWLGPRDFCVEYFPEVDTYLPYICLSSGKVSGDKDSCLHVLFVLYPIGMIVSSVFLLLSIAVYAIVPKLCNLSGKLMICYMVSLLCSFISLTVVQKDGESLQDKACVVLGFIMYFSMLCTFFWLNVLCIDITLTFRPTQSISGKPQERERKKLIFYPLYACGMPVLLTIVAIIAEHHPGTKGTVFQPDFARTCWFYEDFTRMIFFICPVAIILSVNLCLFIYTAYNISIINRKNRQCTDKKDKWRCAKGDKNRLRTYVKLYVVMGITWIMEILSFVIGGSKCIWVFTDMINTLQGLWIFIILICNRKVIGLLRKRFCKKPPAADDPRFEETDSETDDEIATSSDLEGVKSAPGNSMRMKSNTSHANGANPGSSSVTAGSDPHIGAE
ncbi:probable G-protein coupled receptor Mth-like 3 [Ischnura elegans]|uniref:probable G-protein coupled receptor Mth-like 3 n=1 Tax=Ischnura elegans TaxID=197161 RepID=UPI001ED86842|nr:probable G-protein coupled receptor Mth-like 3 [Ischnura elegans]XP_046390302.1 probable G-protein coupled receptor Mth-like 3 [Ischnura elegans]